MATSKSIPSVPPTPAPAQDTPQPIVPPSSEAPTHCPFHRTTDLLQRLAPGKMRIGFFIGAGCPLAIHVDDDNGSTKPLIPDIAGLTKLVKQNLDSDNDTKGVAKKVWERVVERGIANPTVEDVLSHVRTLKSLCGTAGIDGFDNDQLDKLDSSICNNIRSLVSKSHPNIDSPYHVLASWIQAIPRNKPIEIFTTNYDLLIEQALEELRVPYFDGFVGSDSAFLDLESMAEDDLPPRWTRLWKIHGSINWWMTNKGKIRRSRDQVDGEQLLIYPSHLKYDESRVMPYYAMIDRLRVFLRSDQCVLLICGYSFGDPHINAYISQGLAGNPNAACFGMIFNDRSNVSEAVKLAKRHANLTLLTADGAVIGTVERDWHEKAIPENSAQSVTVAKYLPTWRTTAPEDRCKWLLGDFTAFGQFLGYQLSTRDVDQGAGDAG